jgi:hypothetical protein
MALEKAGDCQPSNGHDDLSKLTALLEIAMHVSHFVEGENPVDDRFQRAGFQPADHELDALRRVSSPVVSQILCALMVMTLAIISRTGSAVTPVLSKP